MAGAEAERAAHEEWKERARDRYERILLGLYNAHVVMPSALPITISRDRCYTYRVTTRARRIIARHVYQATR